MHFVLIPGFLVAAGGVVLAANSPAVRRSPGAELVASGKRMPGDIAGSSRRDIDPPEYRGGTFVEMQRGGALELALTGPRPTDMTVGLYDVDEGRPGDERYIRSIPEPTRRVRWDDESVPPGDYILEVWYKDRSSHFWLYWFPVKLN